MKKIFYFKRGDKIPEDAVYLGVRKSLVPTTKRTLMPVYEEILVYEIEVNEKQTDLRIFSE